MAQTPEVKRPLQPAEIAGAIQQSREDCVRLFFNAFTRPEVAGLIAGIDTSPLKAGITPENLNGLVSQVSQKAGELPDDIQSALLAGAAAIRATVNDGGAVKIKSKPGSQAQAYRLDYSPELASVLTGIRVGMKQPQMAVIEEFLGQNDLASRLDQTRTAVSAAPAADRRQVEDDYASVLKQAVFIACLQSEKGIVPAEAQMIAVMASDGIQPVYQDSLATLPSLAELNWLQAHPAKTEAQRLVNHKQQNQETAQALNKSKLPELKVISASLASGFVVPEGETETVKLTNTVVDNRGRIIFGVDTSGQIYRLTDKGTYKEEEKQEPGRGLTPVTLEDLAKSGQPIIKKEGRYDLLPNFVPSITRNEAAANPDAVKQEVSQKVDSLFNANLIHKITAPYEVTLLTKAGPKRVKIIASWRPIDEGKRGQCTSQDLNLMAVTETGEVIQQEYAIGDRGEVLALTDKRQYDPKARPANMPYKSTGLNILKCQITADDLRDETEVQGALKSDQWAVYYQEQGLHHVGGRLRGENQQTYLPRIIHSQAVEKETLDWQLSAGPVESYEVIGEKPKAPSPKNKTEFMAAVRT